MSGPSVASSLLSFKEEDATATSDAKPSVVVLPSSEVFLEMNQKLVVEKESSARKELNERKVEQQISSLIEDERNLTLKQHKRKVSFSNLHIREHSVILGDHPCCEMGLPITLGWDIANESSSTIDEHEKEKKPPRRLSFDERQEMLALSSDECRRAQRKLSRERRCKQNNREQAAFFSPLTASAD
eukprot:CAMPEP_0178921056 /NCGR_PEP_ID=MMETSP0786-20121207/15341_1 /TAXON_ID=186022 /ORGANISM="Thalassionema frauenfeldii, Strain CCMP 1798" /LENGTH=185 /DNA_ID=CAMNT_0020595177 /DNA_START=227 /DNA_END=784 /DNA_ORIENTATION=-